MEHVQNELRREIREKMRQRFDIVEIPRNITINDFCLAAVINLVRLSIPSTLKRWKGNVAFGLSVGSSIHHAYLVNPSHSDGLFYTYLYNK